MAKKSFDIHDTTKSIPHLIFLLAWPVFLEQILTTLVHYADTAMVGQLGKNATSSVTISNTPMFLLNAVVMALGMGVTTMIAQATGAKDSGLVRRLEKHAVLIIIFIGIPITAIMIALHRAIPIWMGAPAEILDTAANYNLIVCCGRIFMIISMVLNSAFRGYGDTKTPMKINMTMNVVNIIGNFFLINETKERTIFGATIVTPGAGWGVEGAAAATAFSMMVAGVIALLVLYRRNNEYKLTLHESYKPEKELCQKIFRISLPAMLERICMSSAGMFVTKSVATLGTTAIASNSLSLTAESISYMPAFSFQTAATTLVGQCLGAGKPDRAHEFIKHCLIIATAIMAATTVLLYIFSPQLLRFFTPDPDVIELGSKCLRVMAIIQIPQAICWIYTGGLRGAGDTKMVFYITAITTWGVRTLWSILCIRVFHFGVVSIHWVMAAEIMVRLVLVFLRYRSGKWKTMNFVANRKTAEAEA